MYEFHYDYMKPKYGHKAKLMYQDTDLLVYHIETEDFDREMWRKDFIQVTIPKMIKGRYKLELIRLRVMKDKLGGKIMIVFIVLRDKMY